MICRFPYGNLRIGDVRGACRARRGRSTGQVALPWKPSPSAWREGGKAGRDESSTCPSGCIASSSPTPKRGERNTSDSRSALQS